MKDIIVIILSIISNFILYWSFGTVALYRNGRRASFSERILTGFFAYYAVFFVFCVPVMKYYRPLSMLTHIWMVVVALVVIAGVALEYLQLRRSANCRQDSHGGKYSDSDGALSEKRDFGSASCDGALFEKGDSGSVLSGGFAGAFSWIRENPALFAGISLLILVQVVLVSCTYNFTLDAAYYVAGVSTNVDTNMINVYDPFTGAWQDHFEMRYFFATYSVQDAVVCQLTGINPLIWTKSVMASVIIILTNLVYYLIARELVDRVMFKQDGSLPGETSADGAGVNAESAYGDGVKESGRERGGRGYAVSFAKKRDLAVFLMLAGMFIINITFNTIYTSSLFLMTRTYEGKAIVGNLAVFCIFYMFLKMSGEETLIRPWMSVFLICFGSSTISSTANMLMPVELTVLFLPLIVMKRRLKWIPKYVLCIVPGLAFALAFVLYVKGYFVFYTYPR